LGPGRTVLQLDERSSNPRPSAISIATAPVTDIVRPIEQHPDRDLNLEVLAHKAAVADTSWPLSR
jgi:hypothetical protein